MSRQRSAGLFTFTTIMSTTDTPIAIAFVKEKQIALSHLAGVYLLIILCT